MVPDGSGNTRLRELRHFQHSSASSSSPFSPISPTSTPSFLLYRLLPIYLLPPSDLDSHFGRVHTPCVVTMPGFDFSNYNRNAALHAKGVPLPKATSTGTTIVGCIYDNGVVVCCH